MKVGDEYGFLTVKVDFLNLCKLVVNRKRRGTNSMIAVAGNECMCSTPTYWGIV